MRLVPCRSISKPKPFPYPIPSSTETTAPDGAVQREGVLAARRDAAHFQTRRSLPHPLLHRDNGTRRRGTPTRRLSAPASPSISPIPLSLQDPRWQKKGGRQASKVPKKTTKKTSGVPPGGRGPPKRVLAPSEPNQPARLTRQRTKELTLTQSDVGSLGRSPGPEEVATRSSPTIDSPNHEGSPQPADVCATPSTATPDALASADFPTQSEEQRHMGDERNRCHYKGKGLERISRGLCTKIPIHIAEGKRRPEAPMQATKLASEGGIILRQHLPILPHWKEYKKNEHHISNYIAKLQLSLPWTPVPIQSKLHALICLRVDNDRCGTGSKRSFSTMYQQMK